jgi:hypothetical protein
MIGSAPPSLRIRFLVLAFLLGVATIARAASPDDEAIANFKKYYGTYKDTPSRVEGSDLRGDESTAVVEVPVEARGDRDRDVRANVQPCRDSRRVRRSTRCQHPSG